jgi:hypothetical protein
MRRPLGLLFVLSSILLFLFILVDNRVLSDQSKQHQENDAAYRSYLPFISREIPPTPTPTPTMTPMPTSTPTQAPTPTVTPTPSPTACNTSLQGVSDPSFEYGGVGWIVVDGVPHTTTSRATDGVNSLMMGGYSNSEDTVAQYVPIPTWAEWAYLSFDYYLQSYDSTTYPYDALAVRVTPQNYPDNLLADVWLWNTGVRGYWFTYGQLLSDIRPYRGGNLILMMAALTDSSYASGWWLDRVRIVFSCGSAAASVREESVTIEMKRADNGSYLGRLSTSLERLASQPATRPGIPSETSTSKLPRD